MYTLRVKSHFDAAHFLPWHEGQCKNLHGHRWEVEVVLEAKELDENGVVVDFGMVKDILSSVLPDHQPLNASQYLFSLVHEFPEYETVLTTMANVVGNWITNPTAERIAEKIFHELEPWLTFSSGRVNFVELTVRESPKCGVTYRPPPSLSPYQKWLCRQEFPIPRFSFHREVEADPAIRWDDNETTGDKP